MTGRPGVRLAAETRHQTALLARDPGPMIGYVVMGLLLITALRPLYTALGRLVQPPALGGIDQAAAGIAVMFSLFALKVGAAHLLNERTWHTWDRLRASPAGFGEILVGKALPIFAAIAAQQAILFGFSAAVFGLRPRAGWWALAVCALAWSACVLLMGTGASTLARSPAQLSAAGDVFALLTTVLGGSLAPAVLLPGWLRHLAPVSPGYWALDAYRNALSAGPAQLGRPLAMLAVFALAGVGIAALIAARPRLAALCLQRRGNREKTATAPRSGAGRGDESAARWSVSSTRRRDAL
jgi:ABC-2 type transport system permease protein